MQTQLNQQKNNIAFVIGNGKSRLEISLPDLKSLGTTFGCNAQYREFSPDYLVAVDVKMILEIIDSGYHLNNKVWTNVIRNMPIDKNLNYFKTSHRYSSGPTALRFAAITGHDTIYILGFDYTSENGLVNNVYADTQNYRKSNERATYHKNWLSQTESIIAEFKNKKFIRVISKDCSSKNIFSREFSNLEQITYDEFKKIFGLE